MDKTDFKPEELVAKYEPIRKKTGIRAKVGLFVGIPLFVGGFLVFFIAMPLTNNYIFAVIGAIMVCLGVLFMTIAFTAMSKFNKKVYVEIKKTIMDIYFPVREENPNKGFDPDEIINLGFFDPHYNHYKGRNFMSSTISGIPFRKADYEFTKSDSNSDTPTTTAKGTVYFFDFEREFAADLKIIEKGYPNFNKRKKFTEVETEYIKFNNKFRVLTSDEKLVFYILTPQLQEKILELEKHYKGGFYLDFVNSDLYLLIDDANSTREISVFKPLTVERINKTAFTIATPKIIVDTLQLASNKFKNNAGIK